MAKSSQSAVTQSAVELDTTLGPNGGTRQSTTNEALPHGRPIQIVRRVKIPEELGITGIALLVTEDEFLNYVGPKNRRYLRWNNVDFASQSVVVFAKQYGVGAPTISIRSVERLESKLIVHVTENWGGFGPRPAVNSKGWDAVVIRKTGFVDEISIQKVSVPENAGERD